MSHTNAMETFASHSSKQKSSPKITTYLKLVLLEKFLKFT